MPVLNGELAGTWHPHNILDSISVALSLYLLRFTGAIDGGHVQAQFTEKNPDNPSIFRPGYQHKI